VLNIQLGGGFPVSVEHLEENVANYTFHRIADQGVMSTPIRLKLRLISVVQTKMKEVRTRPKDIEITLPHA